MVECVCVCVHMDTILIDTIYYVVKYSCSYTAPTPEANDDEDDEPI